MAMARRRWKIPLSKHDRQVDFATNVSVSLQSSFPLARHASLSASQRVSFGRPHGAFPSLPGGVKSKDLQAHMLEPSSGGMQKERFGRWDMIAIRVMLGAFTDGD